MNPDSVNTVSADESLMVTQRELSGLIKDVVMEAMKAQAPVLYHLSAKGLANVVMPSSQARKN